MDFINQNKQIIRSDLSGTHLCVRIRSGKYRVKCKGPSINY